MVSSENPGVPRDAVTVVELATGVRAALEVEEAVCVVGGASDGEKRARAVGMACSQVSMPENGSV